MIIITLVIYIIIGAILGTLYHANLENSDKSYSFEEEGIKPIFMAIFWPIGIIIFATYHWYKSR